MSNLATSYVRKLADRSYFSQACQDLFVLDMLSSKHAGLYIEIGAAHPYESSNTYLLESEFDWRGISVELDEDLSSAFRSARRNKCFQLDALKIDYSDFFKENSVPQQVDYLSIDIDPAQNTYNVLTNLPHENYRFSVITYEHDTHVSGDEFKNKSRNFLQNAGYTLVVGGVRCFGRDFEDWWIDPQVVEKDIWSKYVASDVEFSSIFQNLQK